MWFIGVEVEQETGAPPPKKNSWIRPCVNGPRAFIFKRNHAGLRRIKTIQMTEAKER